MLLEIIIIITIVNLFGIGVILYLAYEKYNSIMSDITRSEEAISELESFEYHSETDIKDWIDESTRDMQYDLDQHGSDIEDLSYNKASQDDIEESHDKLKNTMKEDFENVGVLIDVNKTKIKNITKYLTKTSGYRPEPDVIIDEKFEDYCKSFDEMEIWSDARLSEHYKCLSMMLDDGVYHPDYKGMGCETTYKYYLKLTQGDKNE